MMVRTRKLGSLIALLLGVAMLSAVPAGPGAARQTATETPADATGASTPVASPSAMAMTCGEPAAGAPILPVAANPIANTSTEPGLTITQVLVENNVDPATGRDAADHLEIALTNDTDRELTGFEVYYMITDLVTGDAEGYHCKLAGFSIAPGASRSVHFDDTGQVDHYPDNPFSLYHLSMNEMQVDVTVSAEGVMPQTATVKKDAGGDEDPND
jgi:hypothetical protein